MLSASSCLLLVSFSSLVAFDGAIKVANEKEQLDFSRAMVPGLDQKRKNEKTLPAPHY